MQMLSSSSSLRNPLRNVERGLGRKIQRGQTVTRVWKQHATADARLGRSGGMHAHRDMPDGRTDRQERALCSFPRVASLAPRGGTEPSPVLLRAETPDVCLTRKLRPFSLASNCRIHSCGPPRLYPPDLNVIQCRLGGISCPPSPCILEPILPRSFPLSGADVSFFARPDSGRVTKSVSRPSLMLMF